MKSKAVSLKTSEIDKLLVILPKKIFEDSEMIEGPLLKLQK